MFPANAEFHFSLVVVIVINVFLFCTVYLMNNWYLPYRENQNTKRALNKLLTGSQLTQEEKSLVFLYLNHKRKFIKNNLSEHEFVTYSGLLAELKFNNGNSEKWNVLIHFLIKSGSLVGRVA